MIVKSSNVGAIKIGLRLGAERLSRLRRALRLRPPRRRPTFPARTRHRLERPTTVNDSALASMSMGYQVGVTPLQMAAAASVDRQRRRAASSRASSAPSIRNGRRAAGAARRSCRPHDQHRDRGGADADHGERRHRRHRQARADRRLHRRRQDRHGAASSSTAATRHTDYNASFVGFVPSRNPVFTIIVVIDSPHRRTATRRRRRRADLQEHRRGRASVSRRAAEHQSAAAGSGARGIPTTPASTTVSMAGQPRHRGWSTRRRRAAGTLPDLAGLSARDAVRRLATARRVGADDRRRPRRRPGSAAPGSPLESAATRRCVSSARSPGHRAPARQRMTVGELLRALARTLPASARPEMVADAARSTCACTGVAYDSRRVAPGIGVRRAARAEGRRR